MKKEMHFPCGGSVGEAQDALDLAFFFCGHPQYSTHSTVGELIEWLEFVKERAMEKRDMTPEQWKRLAK